MLHIILAILKVIGIVLLVILGIVIALILLVLFVPVRYDAHLVKEDGPFHADGRFGWLFHLAGGDLCYEDRKARIRLKVFGKVLKTICIPKGPEPSEETSRAETSAKAEEPSEAKEAAKAEEPSEAKEAAKAKEPSEAREAAKAEESAGAEESGRKADGPAAQESAGKKTPQRSEEASEKKRSAKPAKAEMKAGSPRTGGGKGRMEEAIGRLADKIRLFTGKLWDLAMKALETPSEIGDRIDSLAEGADRKIRKASEKAGPFVSADALAFYRRVLGYLGRFLKSCRCRRFDGYLTAGTGEPDRTGELIGLLYLALPQAAGKYELQPDFYQKVIRTDTRLKGHVRLNHALMLVLRLLKDKEFRKLLRVIRHKKDGKKTASGRKKNRKRKLR